MCNPKRLAPSPSPTACSPGRLSQLPLFAIGVAVINAKLTSYDTCSFRSGFSYEKIVSSYEPSATPATALPKPASPPQLRPCPQLAGHPASLSLHRQPQVRRDFRVVPDTKQHSPATNGLAAQLREDVCLQLSRPKLLQPPIRLSAPAQSARIALSNPFRGVRYG